MFAAARKKMDATWGDKPKDAAVLRAALRDLMLGLAEKKRRSVRHFARLNLMPIAKDSVNGPAWVANLALVYAWTGERDRALEQLEIVATIPGHGADIRRSPLQSVLG